MRDRAFGSQAIFSFNGSVTECLIMGQAQSELPLWKLRRWAKVDKIAGDTKIGINPRWGISDTLPLGEFNKGLIRGPYLFSETSNIG